MKKIKKKVKKRVKKTCMDCSDHEVICDPDPHDWFCDDDMAVICKLAKNPDIKPDSKYMSDRQEFRTSACSCRPYRLDKEATIPTWCPNKKKSAKKKVKSKK